MMSNSTMGSREARRAAIVTGQPSQIRARQANATHRDAQRSRAVTSSQLTPSSAATTRECVVRVEPVQRCTRQVPTKALTRRTSCSSS